MNSNHTRWMTTLDAIDRAEDQIERGEVHDWEDLRVQVRSQFPRRFE
jgi:hypothetical protein